MRKRKTTSFSPSEIQRECRDPRWEAIRQQVFERDGYVSVESGKPAEQVHHLEYLVHDDGSEFHYWEYIDHLDCLVSLTKVEHCKKHGIVYEHHFDDEYETEDEVAAKVYITHDYDKFAFLDINRDVDHSLKIEKNIKKYGAVPRSIYVYKEYGKLWIIDGQNSFMARKELNLPIPYSVLKVHDEDELREILYAINSAMKNWQMKDRIFSLASSNPEHKKVVDLMKKYTFLKPTKVWQVICSFNKNEQQNRLFTSQEFKLKDIDKTIKYIEALENISKTGCEIKYWNYSDFVYALVQMCEAGQIELNRFLDKFVKAYNKNSIYVTTKWSGTVQYKDMIRNVYNFQAGKNQYVNIPID